ncbi:GGDEF domain-containing protein [Aquamicrobium zhengzhouense]|uniref:diguanylate cyclase n=1 Tax=Aquamicrobium zhengzhouense TaxID=2781738 RepID=A0ABS0SFP7_9HYPH|nr:GGDEF domain-containing protein [Aquamicrobium zhengzhouense]MBI1622086.1 GGDEF domain-containing protein [Aquamicrobium zhengzhouense]
MSGAYFILIIGLSITGLFITAFVAIAMYDRRYVAAWWFAGTYIGGFAYALTEFLLPYTVNVQLEIYVLGHAIFLLAVTLLNFGLARHYAVAPPIRLLVAVFVVSVAVNLLTQGMMRDSLTRMFIYQAPYFVMQMIGAGIVLRSLRRSTLDLALAGLMVITALHYLAKPLVAIAVGGPGANPSDYLSTTYAMVSQSGAIVLVVATGLLLLLILGKDIVGTIALRAETDVLSGLLNRRGFDARFSELSHACTRQGLPISLIACDLDHFKSINDSLGHAAGDRLISQFGAVLRDEAEVSYVIARTGGEEFSILLPRANLHVARLFAERVRTAFGNSASADLPAGHAISASFGVAELGEGEASQSLVDRADAALYEAKRSGRNCVRYSLFSGRPFEQASSY